MLSKMFEEIKKKESFVSSGPSSPSSSAKNNSKSIALILGIFFLVLVALVCIGLGIWGLIIWRNKRQVRQFHERERDAEAEEKLKENEEDENNGKTCCHSFNSCFSCEKQVSPTKTKFFKRNDTVDSVVHSSGVKVLPTEMEEIDVLDETTRPGIRTQSIYTDTTEALP